MAIFYDPRSDIQASESERNLTGSNEEVNREQQQGK